jgi:DNA primase small subunit
MRIRDEQALKSFPLTQKIFREYYLREFSLSKSFPMIDRHEFGFALFEGWMLRHKSFKSSGELKEFLQSSVPSDAYCSCAYYEDPEADMDKKGWLGADLVFDIDADHIPTSCDKVHDNWVCGICGLTGKGFTPSKCPVCGGEKFEVKTWPCEVCLSSAKTETVKLLDILMRDFGFSEKDIRVFFSGHRGYHVHVESEAIRTLDGIARKEIVDYVTGLGLDVFFYGLSKKSLRETRSSQVSPLSELGWRKRIALGMQNFILNAKEENLRKIGLKKNIAETILQNRDTILKNLNKGTWGAIRGIGFETWRKIAKYSAKLQSAEIDTVVTTDIHRLIRLADTLHGKTGLKKVEFPVSTIEDFDPFKRAVVFKTGAVTVLVSDTPEFRLGDEVYGPYKQQKVELPTAAAMLLVCKGRAEVIE